MTRLASGLRIGPFELQRPLGRGGSGEVWEALLHGPGGFRKPVALKMLRELALVDPKHRELLLREARLGARLQHPNIVSTLLVGEYDERLCVALELVRGRSLQQLVGSTGPLPPTALLDVGEQVASALHHVHTFRYNGQSCGMVHRDVKPANVLVDGLGVVKLADLGISIGVAEAGGVAGTPSYMAPEQWAGQAEPRSDLFSLGVTLYSLALGHLPFQRRADARAAAREVEGRLAEPDFMEPLEARCPGLGRVVRACLRADPSDRPPSAWSVAQVLAELRSSAPAGPSLRAILTDAAPELAMGGGMPSASPTPTAPQPRGNLRLHRDTFIGRDEELASLRSLVAEGAWIVLLGPGGMGKTRLSMELARRMQLEMPGGVWAVDLSEARSVDDVCGAVANAFDVPLGRGDTVEQLGHALAARGTCLVVLDNLEQCVEALAATVDRWRHMAPAACLLGTSRIRPGLADEQVMRLGVLGAAEAEQLFAARASRPLTGAERADVAALCAALEHMPLPVELAAARVALMPVADILDRLSMRLLSSQGRERPARHRSVEASLRWSQALLGDAGQTALAQLSVFDGEFDLAAAEAVLDLGADAPWALDVLEELVDASLVRVDGASGRFAMWVVVREFAAELLEPEARDLAERRHGEHFARREVSAEAAVDMDNVVAACRRAVARADVDVACRALGVASAVYARRGPVLAAVELASTVCALDLPPAWGCRARLDLVLALISADRREAAGRVAERGLEEARACGDRRVEGLLSAARAVSLRGRAHEREVRQGLEAALVLHRAVGDLAGECRTLMELATEHRIAQRLDASRACGEAALAIAESTGDVRMVGVMELSLGAIAGQEGRMEASRDHFLRALDAMRASGDDRAMATVYSNLGISHALQRKLREATAYMEGALRVQRERGSPANVAHTLTNLALAYQSVGDLAAARACIREALDLRARQGSVTVDAFLHLAAGCQGLLSGQLDEGREHLRACLEAGAQTGDERFDAPAHAALAEMARREGDFATALDHARDAMAAAEAFRDPRALAEVLPVKARVLLDRGGDAGVEAAEQLMQRARGVTTQPSRAYTQCCAVRAVLRWMRGDVEAAAEALAEAEAEPLAEEEPWSVDYLAWARERTRDRGGRR